MQGSGLSWALPGLDAAMDSRSPFAAAARQLQPQGGSLSSRGTSFSLAVSARSRRSSELLEAPQALPANPAALLQVSPATCRRADCLPRIHDLPHSPLRRHAPCWHIACQGVGCQAAALTRPA